MTTRSTSIESSGAPASPKAEEGNHEIPSSVLDLIGNTPLYEVKRLDTGKCRLFLKLENQNPGGSIKDRVALSMINDAERKGILRPGGTIIEATAGNTGLGLALVAAAKGYQVQLVIPDKMSAEKVSHIRALGAKVLITRSDVGKGHPQYYQDLALTLSKQIPGSFYIDQFNNPANPLAHETSTAPEIWEQLGHSVDAVACGVGSGGTITGLGRFFRRVNPKIEMVLADPEGSVLAPYIETGKIGTAGSWTVEGIGEDFIPGIADLSLVSKAYSVTDRESFLVARELLHKEGILAGSSSGTILAAALRYCREQKTEKRVVSLVCDSGNKYLSKMFNDQWMIDQGFLERKSYGDLRDYISRRAQDGSVISVGPADPLLTAYQRMRSADISQVPVIKEGRIVGLLDESDLLLHVHRHGGNFHDAVSTAMSSKLETLTPDRSLGELIQVLDSGYVALIVEKNQFQGLITRTDLLAALRRQSP
jgi:cystathionine beta-synthase